MQSPNFIQHSIAHVPAWLSKPWGRAFMGAIGSAIDVIRSAYVYAVKAGFVSICPDGHLAAHGWDRDLERGPAESASSYRLRLLRAWDIYPWNGTDKAIVDALKDLGLVAAVVRDRGRAWIRDDAQPLGGRFVTLGATAFTHDSKAPGEDWCRLWVVIDLTSAPPAFFESFTDVAAAFPTFGAWAAAGIAWGSTMDLGFVELIRRLVFKWTQGGAQVVEILAIHRGRCFGFPLAETYADLPADTLASYVARFEGW